MATIKDVIDNLISANAKHIAELYTEEEVKQWLNSILWSVAGFKQSVNEEELDKLATIEGAKAISHFVNREQSKFSYEWADLVKGAYKAGYRKAKQE